MPIPNNLCDKVLHGSVGTKPELEQKLNEIISMKPMLMKVVEILETFEKLTTVGSPRPTMKKNQNKQ